MTGAVASIDKLVGAYSAGPDHYGNPDYTIYARKIDELLKKTDFPLEKAVQIIRTYINSSGFYICSNKLHSATQSTILKLVDGNLDADDAIRLIPAFSRLSDYAEPVSSLSNATLAALDYMAATGHSAEEVVQKLQALKEEMKKQRKEGFPKWMQFLVRPRFTVNEVYPIAFRTQTMPNF